MIIFIVPCAICGKMLERHPSRIRRTSNFVCGPAGSACHRANVLAVNRAGCKPLSDRLWENVDIRGPSDCWEFQGYKDKAGYGRIKDAKKIKKAHRVAWELTHGRKIHEGFLICHHCDNPSCCNPAHLYLGTYRQNARDRVRRGRGWSPKGVANPNSKLTEDQIREIRKRAETGETHTRIAEDYPVSQTTVSRVARRAA